MTEPGICKVTFQPQNISIEVAAETTVMEAARLAEMVLSAPCGGLGRCGRCIVKVQFPGEGFQPVQACKFKVTDGMIVEIPIGEISSCIDNGLLAQPGVELNFDQRSGFGVAIDLGTTTIAGYLYSLSDGRQISVSSTLNGQISYGSDVISRLAKAVESPEVCLALKKVLINDLDSLINVLCQKAAVQCNSISELVIVGNAPMISILLHLPLESLSQAPYEPYARGPFHATGYKLGLRTCSQADCYFPPLIGGFVGSDALAASLAQNIDGMQGTSILLDIGTNAEIILRSKERILAMSAAAGPALEGGNISCGMIALPGAISKIQINHDLKIDIVESQVPQGLCGSGLIDALAEMLRIGVIRADGYLVEQKEAPPVIPPLIKARLKDWEQDARFILTGKIYISQKDIREVQLAIAAVAAAIEVALLETGVYPEQVDQIFLAGGFGNYLNPANACRVGLLSEFPLNRVKQVGNAAGYGAVMMLLSDSVRKRAEALAGRFEHITLANIPKYQELFIKALRFPEKECAQNG